MGIIEVQSQSDELSVGQRWANALTIFLAAGMIIFGFFMRQNIENAVVIYSDTRSGITAQYPQNWLLDTGSDEYVFRVRNMSIRGFKTLIQVSIQPVSPDTTIRNIADRLAFIRAQTVTDYNVLTDELFTLREGLRSQSVSYSFVQRPPAPFLESIPSIVLGQDIITLTRGQSIIITFQADADVFDQEYEKFEAFLATLQF